MNSDGSVALKGVAHEGGVLRRVGRGGGWMAEWTALTSASMKCGKSVSAFTGLELPWVWFSQQW